MKKIVVLIAIALVSIACKKEAKKETIKKEEVATLKYPKVLEEVLEKHGGIEQWKKMKTLSFTLKNEEHTTDLHSRKTVVNSPEYSLGFDGKEVWLQQQDSTAFKGTPEFYYNLYFYFYAMPFVLADDGIVYSETKPLTFKGVSYPGIKISYKANVGTSPDDNYFIFYHPETKQMAWLGYTVTYFSKEPTDAYKIIRYNDWENVNGLLLPKSITWYAKDENGQPTEPGREPIQFKMPLLSEASLANGFYEKPKE
ncbi:DUF6503 family protein [Tenacibaculum singaporense]|uniref:DUF6503 family protein n=1 Tax=Tenacibaculum singaporense TaxID=2358479 RepID=UPI000F6626B7|nr:DUF6503 family protein [Tenacibaculum singaporense]RSC92677.1 hypothetical protein EI424_12900 [Tenacibaculum singaporense]